MTIAAKELVERHGVWQRVRAAGLESALAAAALFAVSLHVLDDSFFQPAAGTGAADHLISGLVPVAVLLAAAGVYPLVRPGLRAAVAVVLGLLGVVIGGVEPVYYGSRTGLSGDDYTAVAAAAGGLLLIVLGGIVAWRSRRLDEPRVRRYARRSLIGLGALLAIAFVLLPLSLAYGFTHVARTKTERGNLGAAYERVSFEAGDGLRLSGWFVPARNGATVIVYPGKKGTQAHARMLVRHGYGVLVFDRRGEGDSEGDPNALGWGFDNDLKGAIAYLRRRPDVDAGRIGGLGLSVGGEALIQTAGETTGLRAVVSDGAGSRSIHEDTIDASTKDVPEIVFSGVMTAGMVLFSNQAPPPSLESVAGRITSTPVFFIYADRGAGGEDSTPAYYAAVRAPKQIWKIRTTHTHGLQARPQEYERRVLAFFDRTLRG